MHGSPRYVCHPAKWDESINNPPSTHLHHRQRVHCASLPGQHGARPHAQHQAQLAQLRQPPGGQGPQEGRGTGQQRGAGSQHAGAVALPVHQQQRAAGGAWGKTRGRTWCGGGK